MSDIKLIPDYGSILEHLQFLFSGHSDYSDGKIEIAYTDTAGNVNKAEWFDATDIEKAAQFAANINKREGINVYVGAALRLPETPPIGRSSLEDYYAATAIWCDIDDAGFVLSAKEKYSKLPPSLIVVTGREPSLRAQMWWKIMHPQTDSEAHKRNLAHICAALGGDRAVVDPARVMRLAGSIAWPHKKGRVAEMTELRRPDRPTVMDMSERFPDYFPDAVAPLTAMASGEVGQKARNIITKKLDIQSLLEATRVPGHWHINMRDAVASMVNRSWSNEQIRLSCAPYCDDGLFDKDLTVLIDTARNKWQKPDIIPDIQEEQFDPETGEILPPAVKTLPLLYAGDIQPVTDTSDFIEGLLCDQQFSVIYGESNCGKTFFMLDLAMHVAMGRNWRGKAVEQGGVIYAALEGGHGTRNRIAAFKRHYGIEQDIPLAVIPSSINFLGEGGDIEALINSIRTAKERTGSIRLIVIDTLARAISGGDENSSVDMGRMVIISDMIRAVTGAHIAFIHHSGKDAVKGARGHSSLRAAVDTEIEISRTDERSPSKIKVVKQREMEMASELYFSLQSIELGHNRRNKAVTSCVVVPVEGFDPVKTVRLTPVQSFIYDAIIDCIISQGVMRNVSPGAPPVRCISYDEMRDTLENRGFREVMATENKTTAQQIKSATQTARLSLRKMGKINFTGAWIWLTEDVRNDGMEGNE